MRTRSKGTRPIGYPMLHVVKKGDTTYRYDQSYCHQYYESITDRNNGSARPNSPCSHTKCIYIPQPWPSYEFLSGPTLFEVRDSVPNLQAGTIAYVVKTESDRIVMVLEQKLQRELYDKLARLADRLSVVNFLAELTDVGSMFKSLQKYRFIDWEFGWGPFLADLGKIAERHDASIEKINARLDELRKPTPVKRVVHLPFHFEKTFAVFPGLSHEIIFSGKISVRINAVAQPEIPKVLSNLELNQARLDMQGWNLDPATLWEATPFSWLVDWFIPIGDSLESISGANFSPKLHTYGSLTVNVGGTFEILQAGDSLNLRPRGSSLGGGTYKSYSRSPYGKSVSSNQLIIPELKLPLPDARKAALLNDIWGIGSSLEDAGLGKKRKGRRKLRA